MSNPYLIKKSLNLSGHKTSVALEAEFWTILNQIAVNLNLTLTNYINQIDQHRPSDQPLATALRITSMQFLMNNFTTIHQEYKI